MFFSLKNKKYYYLRLGIKSSINFSTQVNKILFYKNKKSMHGLSNISMKNNINTDNNVLYIIYVKSSLRGLHINISDNYGRVIKMYTLGQLGYKKAQRYTSITLKSLGDEVILFFKELNNTKFRVNLVLKGFGLKRNKFVNLITRSFLKKNIISIIDLSSLPYNGCRPKKLRRR